MIENIARKTLSPLFEKGHTEYKKFGRQGEIDGKSELPPSESKNISESEKKFLESAVEKWRNFKTQVTTEKHKLKTNLMLIGSKLSHEIDPSEAAAAIEQKKALELLEAEIGEGSTIYSYLREAAEQTENILNDLKIELGRPMSISFKKTYIPLMTVLSLAELFVNRLSFELIFESMPIVSIMLAAAVGILLIFFAHIIGTEFRRSQCPITSLNPNKKYWAIFLISLMSIFLMISLAAMRQQLLDLNAADVNLDQLLTEDSSIAFGSSSGFALTGKSIPFLIINFAIFISGIVLAYFRHDAHPFYERYTNEYAKAKSEFFSHLKNYEKKQVELSRKFNERLSEYREQNKNSRKTPSPLCYANPIDEQVRGLII
jgi:hypothetical protein